MQCPRARAAHSTQQCPRDRIQAGEHDLIAEADRARSDYGQPFAHTQALADARARSAQLAEELAEKDQQRNAVSYAGAAADPPAGSEPATDHPRQRWITLCDAVDARITADTHWPALAAQLERAAASGTDVAAILHQVTADYALPDDHPARSLSYRVAYIVPDLRSPARLRADTPEPTPHPTPPPAASSPRPDAYRPGPPR